jgi:stage V sporulation protein S
VAGTRAGIYFALTCGKSNFITGRRLTMELIKVSANSPTVAVAGSIAKTIREHQQAEVQAIGAAAIYQVMEALILANEYLQGDGIHVGFVPERALIMVETRRLSAVKFLIKILGRPNPSSAH